MMVVITITGLTYLGCYTGDLGYSVMSVEKLKQSAEYQDHYYQYDKYFISLQATCKPKSIIGIVSDCA